MFGKGDGNGAGTAGRRVHERNPVETDENHAGPPGTPADLMSTTPRLRRHDTQLAPQMLTSPEPRLRKCPAPARLACGLNKIAGGKHHGPRVAISSHLAYPQVKNYSLWGNINLTYNFQYLYFL